MQVERGKTSLDPNIHHITAYLKICCKEYSDGEVNDTSPQRGSWRLHGQYVHDTWYIHVLPIVAAPSTRFDLQITWCHADSPSLCTSGAAPWLAGSATCWLGTAMLAVVCVVHRSRHAIQAPPDPATQLRLVKGHRPEHPYLPLVGNSNENGAKVWLGRGPVN